MYKMIFKLYLCDVKNVISMKKKINLKKHMVMIYGKTFRPAKLEACFPNFLYLLTKFYHYKIYTYKQTCNTCLQWAPKKKNHIYLYNAQ
jgi:hypothetical protein